MLLIPPSISMLYMETIWFIAAIFLCANLQAEHFESFKVKVNSFDQIDPIRVLKGLDLCHDEEKKWIRYLEENYALSKEEWQNIFLGAHVVLEDGGEAYAVWSRMAKVRRGFSSHASDSTQYRLKGKLIKELLFSRKEDGGKAYTWFQLERHPLSFGSIFFHAVDYFHYLIDGLNRGPEGRSPQTERNPLTLKSPIIVIFENDGE